MTAGLTTVAGLRALLDGLPTLSPGTELILRPHDDGPTATLRAEGQAPRIFRRDKSGVHELVVGADEGLPGASLLADPARLRTALSDHIGEVRSSQLVAWRPGRRAVVRVQTAHGERWLKFLDRKNWRRAERALAAVGETLPPAQLARPSSVLPDWCGFVAEPAPGTALRAWQATGAELPWTILVRAVLALAYTTVTGELPRCDFSTVRAAALKSLHQGMVLTPFLGALIEPLASLAAPDGPAVPGFVHGDLHDKQLFLARDGVTAIDLDSMAFGDPRFDVVNLAEHLLLRDLQQHGADRGRADLLLTRCAAALDDPATVAFRAVVRARLCGVYALRPRHARLVRHLAATTTTLLERLA